MPNSTFKKEIIINGFAAHVIKRPSGKKTYCYEIRYRRNGFNISASSTDRETAKKRFLNKLIEAIKNGNKDNHSQLLMKTIAIEWLTYKKDKITNHQWKAYQQQYQKYIDPYIGEKEIKKIRTSDFDIIMDNIKNMGRTSEDVRSILNQIFKYAIANGLFTHNPVSLIPYVRADRKHGEALSIEEEKKLITTLNTEQFRKYRHSILAMLFFGLRPCELYDAHFEDNFLVARNRKRKGRKIEYKKIPITSSAEKYIDTKESIKPPCCIDKLRENFHKILPNHKLYHLRHTFATRAEQFVRRNIAEIWIGDSPERLIGKTYIHFPDDFMYSEGRKIDYI